MSDHSDHFMFASLRESRMMIERVVQHHGVGEGMVHAVRDCIVYSAALGLAGFCDLRGQLGLLQKPYPRPLAVKSENGVTTIDCAGGHAWQVADSILDIAIDEWRRLDAPVIQVTNVQSANELAILRPLAQKHLLTAHVDTAGEGASVHITPGLSGEIVLDRIRRNGIRVARALWWDIYHEATQALAVDTVSSRRHAGTLRVEADGSVTGRGDDDETDFSLLLEKPLETGELRQ